MAWLNKLLGRGTSENIEEKLNPAQPHYDIKTESSREFTFSYERAYEDLEIVNRGTNMIVDDCAEINIMLGERLAADVAVVKNVKNSKIEKLLNTQPNPYQDISTFRRNLYIDMLLDGNIFIYWDGSHLYHLPASKMIIHPSEKTYIDKFTFNEIVTFKPSEIIHVKENSFYSIYRGVSRLKPALRTMILMKRMRDFQDNFFKNGAVPGLILKSPNTLSDRIKDRAIANWQSRYSPTSGGRTPIFLDGGLEIDDLTSINFKELDFQAAIADNEKIILKALGIPPIMLDSGNNANLRPNMRMYYLETILPTVKKVNTALERFFGVEILEDLTHIPALQPELRDQAQYYTSLVNAGIITPNEARKNTGFEEIKADPSMDMIRVPANIAGSAVNPGVGGRPTETASEE
jgi:HK97 family phage portal protein